MLVRQHVKKYSQLVKTPSIATVN